MTRSHETLVDDQFGAQASAYVQSAVHAEGEDLEALAAIAAREKPDRACDAGSGGGHVAYRLAAHAGAVTAVDLSAAMTDAVTAAAREKGLTNIETCVAPVESMPFADGTFDFLGCRFSAHHWRDFEAGLREARRVLKPGATAIFIDVIAPGHAAFDTHLQTVETLRDPSHVRDYTASQWIAALDRAGFRVRNTLTRRLRMEYSTWVERMRTAEPHRVAIRSLQERASAETAAYYAIEADGSFTLDTVQIEASACRARA
ncbi:class I SAM-dependent methyltransferase [Parasphingopyxis marina]|uniref:Class I SAM-dependent methyltransferase n=1 Tax=Parasphingopyxis marina TaxID=2761622 RepID=A0A842HUW6_9SPHN|nr:class I SAM-dependent methyltransferase [Parasphingopyxis marina]MBC2776782.1 class I SAM-dependent methyltransferase [Parasphingopyxis marina]